MDIRSHRHMTDMLVRKLAGEMSQDELDDFSRICEAADDCEKQGLEFKIRPRREKENELG